MTNTSTKTLAPVFLVGAERSGTTLLRLMLDHHPQLAFRNEFEFAFDRVSDNSDWPPLEEYYEWLSTHRIFQASGFTIDHSLDYPNLIKSFLEQKKRRDNKKLVGATVHRHFDRVLHIWPEARFIHIIRDGRDVAKSNILKGWAGNGLTGIAKWLEAEKLWDKLSAEVPEARRLEASFEALVTDPAQVLASICEFIGIPFSDALMDYSSVSTYGPPDPNIAYKWKTNMSDYDIQTIEGRAGAMLVKRGYPMSGLKKITISPYLERKLLIQDRLYRLRFRIKRLGLSMVLQDLLARHLGLKQWHKRLTLRRNTIINEKLK